MKTPLSALLIVSCFSTAAWGDHANIAGEYICRGPGCALQNEIDTITIDEGPFPLVTCYSPTAGTSVGIFTSLNVFTCYGSAVSDSGGVYFRFAGFHWFKVQPHARALRDQR